MDHLTIFAEETQSSVVFLT